MESGEIKRRHSGISLLGGPDQVYINWSSGPWSLEGSYNKDPGSRSHGVKG